MIFAMTPPDDNVRLPETSSLDLAMVLDVAEVSNRAQRALGTRLLGLERDGALLGIAPDAGASGAGEWPNGVIAALFDHACAIAALMTLDDADRFVGSVGLRVEYIRPSRADAALHVRAECQHCTDAVALVHAEAFHPDAPAVVVAVGRGTIAVSPDPSVGAP
jgi:acyl-coenzyme A thioesterase PaaI-like protein